MPAFIDKEFGTITIRRSAKARSIRMRVAPDGTLRVSSPLYTPQIYIKRVVGSSRAQLRHLLAQHESTADVLYDGMPVGKSHHLTVRPGSAPSVKRHQQQIIATIPPDMSLSDTRVITAVRNVVGAALRVEAKSYLPKRLAYLAAQHGYHFEKVRFSHASGRWGSCSTNGTISLNIALMKLPFELIDYVLIHELAHTKEMNHSPAFWALVGASDPDYKQHRKLLKTHTPSI